MKSEVESLKERVENLERIVVSGNGEPSILQTIRELRTLESSRRRRREMLLQVVLQWLVPSTIGALIWAWSKMGGVSE